MKLGLTVEYMLMRPGTIITNLLAQVSDVGFSDTYVPVAKFN